MIVVNPLMILTTALVCGGLVWQRVRKSLRAKRYRQSCETLLKEYRDYLAIKSAKNESIDKTASPKFHVPVPKVENYAFCQSCHRKRKIKKQPLIAATGVPRLLKNIK